MSKKYKEKLCAYCAGAESTSADHVFAREFFLQRDRGNLPKVPACNFCNGHKSELEHYLTTILPFGARHSSAEANLCKMVPKRLSKNAKIKRELRDNWRRKEIKEYGIQTPFSTLPIDPSKLHQLFDYIIRGLTLYHWDVYLDKNVQIDVCFVTDVGKNYLNNLFQLNTAAKVKKDLGHGTFVYEGAQGVDSPQLTIWRIETYGELKYFDSQEGVISSCIGAISTFK